MTPKEFYVHADQLWCLSDDGTNSLVTEHDTSLIADMLAYIREYYPTAFSALEKHYSKSNRNISYYQYLIVRRFCKCNFGELDNTAIDIDEHGILHLEKVHCPLRGECQLEGVVCSPKFNSKLSAAEERVMKIYYRSSKLDEIADTLYISNNTVRNHIRSAYVKLGIHSRAEFITYANNHHLYD